MTSKLCSMTTTVLPASTSFCSTSTRLVYVCDVQAGGRLVQDIDGLAGRALGQLGGELDALRLAAGQRGGRLPELDVPQPDLAHGSRAAGRS